MDEIRIDTSEAPAGERAIDLFEVARQKLVDAPRGRLSLQILQRWAGRGLTTAGGRLMFPVFKSGNKYHTYPSWVAAFRRRKHELESAPAPPAAPNAPTRRQASAAAERAAGRLEKMGFKVGTG